jgi:hypothetical protein
MARIEEHGGLALTGMGLFAFVADKRPGSYLSVLSV